MLRLAYIIPEFPGQTHIWMWREILWMQRWTECVHIYSTRRPSERDRARHLFANSAESMTTFLWPARIVRPMLWAITRHPRGFARCLKLCFTLPIGKRARFVHLLKLLPSACVLARDVIARGIEHLHSHSCANSAILAMMVHRLIGVPFSMTINANIDWWGGAMLEKFSEAQFTIAITQWLLEQIRREYPQISHHQVLLGRIGVDTTTWTPPPHPADISDPFCILSVGRLHPSKGHDLLIRAIQLLVERGRDVVLRIAGDGPQRDELLELVRRHRLTDRVTFLGSLGEHQIIAEMRQASAFVLASHAEPLGVVYMEAMAVGVPTIGTQAGGVGEIITADHDGLLVRPNDPVAIANAISRLMDDPALAARLSRNGRNTIIDRFDSRIGALTLYHKITGQNPPADLPEQRRIA
jgi:colanic acid/amylovoran biosynthesis glycosyltransferase